MYMHALNLPVFGFYLEWKRGDDDAVLSFLRGESVYLISVPPGTKLDGLGLLV